MLIGNLAFGCAGLLMLTFAAVRVARRLAEQLELPLQNGARLAGVVVIVGVLLVVEWLWAGVASKLGDVGPLLLLAVYACAAYACARIPKPEPSFGAVAARFFIGVLVAGVVVVPLRDRMLLQSGGCSWVLPPSSWWQQRRSPPKRSACPEPHKRVRNCWSDEALEPIPLQSGDGELSPPQT